MGQDGRFFFICSNGRCGTQFLARQLAQLADGEQVIHETASVAMASRKVFRDPEARLKQIVSHPNLERFLNQVDRKTRNGRRVVFCGWPAYAYLDYFAERFGNLFAYVHLVRNPYVNAASHATHHPMLPGMLNDMQTSCKIFGTDPNLIYRTFAARYGSFGPYDRQLLHWLELTDYVHECRSLPGYRGLVRFEDLFSGGSDALNALASEALGRSIEIMQKTPFDRVHAPNRAQWRFDADPELAQEVDRLALKLGYSREELERARSESWLKETYSKQRFDLPCDPSLPVIEPGR